MENEERMKNVQRLKGINGDRGDRLAAR